MHGYMRTCTHAWIVIATIPGVVSGDLPRLWVPSQEPKRTGAYGHAQEALKTWGVLVYPEFQPGYSRDMHWEYMNIMGKHSVI